MKVLFLALIGFGVCNVSFAQAPQVSSADFSYSYGMLIIQTLKSQGVEVNEIDLEELFKGMEDAVNEEGTRIPENQAQGNVQQWFQAKQAEIARKAQEAQQAFFDENGKRKGVTTLPSGVQYEILVEGDGAIPKATDRVTTHYHGTLLDGTVFDSSVERGQPATFQVRGVINGWQEILQLMPTGSKWKVYIPSRLAYGARGQGAIPPHSALIFEIELISIAQ